MHTSWIELETCFQVGCYHGDRWLLAVWCDFYGLHIPVGSYGNLWVHMATCGFTWQPVGSYGNLWVHMATCGFRQSVCTTEKYGCAVGSSTMAGIYVRINIFTVSGG